MGFLFLLHLILGFIVLVFLDEYFKKGTDLLLSRMQKLSNEQILEEIKNNNIDFTKKSVQGLNIPELFMICIYKGRMDLLGTESFWIIVNKGFPEIVKKVQDNYNTLLLKAEQKTYYDDYGIFDTDGFKKEFSYFIKKVLNPDKEEFQLTYLLAKGIFIYLMKKDGIKSLEEIKDRTNLTLKSVKTGIDYEVYIENILKKAKLEVKRTPTTGDQGVDLIVNSKNIKYAIQCKYYSKPVGNKAIQEIIAGKDFYKCDMGIVCSNNSFTKSAQILAQSQNIILTNEKNIVSSINN